MSEDQVPTREESKYVYEDKPNLLNIMVGGTMFGILFYYISGFAFSQFEYENEYIQYGLGILVILYSFRLGTTVAVSIKIDTATGFIEAENNQFHYTGYAHEPEMFMVLEKTSTANGRTYKDYKLTVKADEETTFDVPIQPNQAREAIQVVEKAKKAVPLKR